MPRQLKTMKSAGIQPARDRINYWLTIDLYEYWDKVNGNSYCGAKVCCNGQDVRGYRHQYGQSSELYRKICTDFGIAGYSSDQHEQGVHVTVRHLPIKWRELVKLKDY